MKRLSAAVKKELSAFERNSSIQTVASADAASRGEKKEAVAPSGKKKKSNKEDEDENAEENEEFDEGKLRFAGSSMQHMIG